MKNSYFFSQVHQLFFSFAFINAILFMLLFMLSFKGVILLNIDVNLFHAISLIFFVFTPALLGFLFTTFPRFLSSQAIQKELYIKIFFLFISSNILFLLASFVFKSLFFLSMFFILISLIYSVHTLYNIYKNSSMPDKHDTKYILIGFSFGILSLLIFLSGFNNTLAINLAIYNFLFFVAFSVAQRMIPFFSHVMPSRNESFLKTVVILLFIHTLLELFDKNLAFAIDLVLAIFIAKEIYRWKLPYTSKNAMLSILHLAILWIPLTFLISFISKALSLFNNNIFLALDIHSLMLGFLFTVLIGFGTRVTIGHSGNMMQDTPYIKFLFIFTQVVVLSRIAVSLTASLGYNFMIIFDISVTVWLLMFIFWLYKFFAVLVFGKKLK